MPFRTSEIYSVRWIERLDIVWPCEECAPRGSGEIALVTVWYTSPDLHHRADDLFECPHGVSFERRELSPAPLAPCTVGAP